MMGVQLMEQARQAGVAKFVAVGTICAYPKFTPVPFREDDLWNGYPEETNAPYGLAKKMLLVQSQAYRQQYGFNSIFLLPVNLYGPRDNFDPRLARDPGADPEVRRGAERREPEIVVWGTGAATREFLYVEDAAEAICSRPSATTAPSRSTSAPGRRSRSATSPTLIAQLTGFNGRDRLGHVQARRPAAPLLDTAPRRRAASASAPTPFEDGLRRTIDWYRQSRAAAR